MSLRSQGLDFIGLKRGVTSDDDRVQPPGLRDKHSVERIAMMGRQPTCLLGVLEPDGNSREAGRFNGSNDPLRSVQLSERPFDLDLPDRYS